ncbi:MAG: chemotaxis protein CheA [Phycisphaerae bacterium]|nr:chemotaxis protein CheA [Gemmatimonadaceae bacterium]
MIPTTLEDAALLLLQLETTDTADLTELRDSLVALVFENRISTTVQPHVARAARLLGGILDGSTANAAADFKSVNEALESALAVESPAAPVKVARPAPVTAAPVARTQEGLPDDTDLELLRDFLNEAAEYIEASEVALLALEADPQDSEAVNTVFRAFHTVKGTAAFLGLTHIAEFAHEAESLLSRVRDREFSYGPGCADLSLRSVDMLKALLGAVEHAIGDGALVRPEGYARLIAALTNYSPDQDAASVGAVPMVEAGPRAQRNESVADATIRVRTDRLDRLINMVGELVIAQTMIGGDDLLANGLQPDLGRKITHAGKIVRELQELSMSMRMVPLRSTFQKLARVVRDTASKVGKSVHFTTDGDEVEIDRNLVDILADPLVHMVRNAVDHGIELPNDRSRSGKSSTGTVRLSAYHASGNVVVDLIDDGAGLDRVRIVNKAIEKGLIESDRGMSDSEVFNLIFAPGFSTAEKVTDISGRGVGLDVVRRNLELIRGRLEISSSPGAGTTFSLRLPLTLAVTDGMLVRVGSERFVIPLTQIHMSFRPEQSMLSTVVGKGEMVRLRGSLMPVVRLHRMFSVQDAIESPLQALLVIVGDGAQRTALMVDELLGQQQVVAKPLGEALGRIPGFSGGAILGDGRVGLILDVRETTSLTAPPLKLAS